MQGMSQVAELINFVWPYGAKEVTNIVITSVVYKCRSQTHYMWKECSYVTSNPLSAETFRFQRVLL